MKIFLFTMSLLFLASCTTEYTCSCSGGGQDFESTIISDSASDAENQCAEIEMNAEDAGMVDITCILREN